MIQRQFLDFGGITHSAGGRGRGVFVGFFRGFFFKKNSPIYVFFDLRGFNYLGLVWFRVCMDGFVVADTAAGRKVDGRQSSSLTPHHHHDLPVPSRYSKRECVRAVLTH